MRVSAIAFHYRDRPLREALAASDRVTEISHDHPEGIRGTRTVTEAVRLAFDGKRPSGVRRAITLPGHPSRWAEDRIGRSELLITRWRGSTARRRSSRGFVPQEPASADDLERLRRHDRPSEDMPPSPMGQWANDKGGADPADCADAGPSRRARRRIGGEHDAQAHGGVPCRRRPDRDQRFRELLGTLSPCARRAQSQDRNAGITSGEICSLLQAGKASARTSESHA